MSVPLNRIESNGHSSHTQTHTHTQLPEGVQQLADSPDDGSLNSGLAPPLQRGFSTGEQFTPLRMRVCVGGYYRGGGGGDGVARGHDVGWGVGM